MGLVTPPCKKVHTTETSKRNHRNLIQHGRAEMPLYNETMTTTGQSQMDAITLTTQVFHAKKQHLQQSGIWGLSINMGDWIRL